MPEESREPFAEWVILELMGHRRLAGHLTEVEVAGEGFLRLDVYSGDSVSPSVTQLYRPGAVYCITPTVEPLARSIAKQSSPAPVTPFELERDRAEPLDAYEFDEAPY